MQEYARYAAAPKGKRCLELQESRVTDRASLTERSVTRTTGNKIDPDKHRLMHIRANAVQTQMPAQTNHRYREFTTTSHTYTSTSSLRARTRARSRADATTPVHKLRITHIIIFSHAHTHCHRQSETHALTQSHTFTNTDTRPHGTCK